MSKKKVLVICDQNFFPENRSGLQKILSPLLADPQIADFTFLCLEKCRELPYAFTHIKTKYLGLLPAAEPGQQDKNRGNIPWIHTLKKNIQRFFSEFPIQEMTPLEISSLTENIQQMGADFDIIHLVGHRVGILLRFFTTEDRAKTIYSAIDSPALYWSRRAKTEKNPILKFFWQREFQKAVAFEREFFQLANKIHLVSSVDASFSKKLGTLSSPALVIPVGIDLDKFPLLERKKTNNLLFVGNFNYAPNAEAAYFLINKFMPKLKSIAPEARLFLIGDGVPPELLEQRSENIQILGFVDDLKPYLENTALFLSPLTFGSGIKNKILESMASGIPIIGTPISFDGIPIVTGLHCVEVERDPETWTQIAAEMLQQQDLMLKIRAEARKMIEDFFSWSSLRLKFYQ